ncbi:amino acid ABC transporter substrate-binding protein [Syntrophobacter fumaroxidans]|uniref:Extracellular solute-binding protein, family 3 n=1 Tax=Syntrophobacter fumaroxidans (strain DSM 10017 / MPOB) TaxID=335543 RepID=A0LJY2_SYNFM|nr:amino acid ABC transporter substrate-binding protein [Syntrophobacter fumaroxidans]ABK17734.1 extracellular solute-binding protein, family 3 [Syntrophobacter fumaroxidans MPOB]
MELLQRTFGFLVTLLIASVLLFPENVASAGDTLIRIKARGKLRCGVSDGIPGFSWKGPDGRWTGMDVDFCRALAAAVLKDPEKVDFVPLTASRRFPALKAGELDVLARNTTWTMEREAVLGILFAGVLVYDTQGFLVPTSSGITELSQLDGATVCVVRGSSHEEHIAQTFGARNWTYQPLQVESSVQAMAALNEGKCKAFTSESPQLKTARMNAPDGPDQYSLLKETISEEPMGPVVRRGDEDWFTIVRWVLFTLILAEDGGYTGANVRSRLEKTADFRAMSWKQLDGLIAKSLGIDPGWRIRVVESVGNYGEVFERNLGSQSTLNLERGPNKLWKDAGLMYAPPFR